MSTKTSLKYASNSHSGGIMENHSPAALLDMLAEVASQTLHSEKNHTNTIFVPSGCKSKADTTKKKPQELFTAAQLLSMPASQLVKQFSIFISDELKRQYSYTCALMVGCGQKYTSFASEGKARMSIKAHLAEHLQYLKANKEAYNSFTAIPINSKNNKVNVQGKKNRLLSFKKPQEAVNKENKNTLTEKSANYLRNILLQDVSFKEVQKDKNLERKSKCAQKKSLHTGHKDPYKIEHKVFGDHSYFERVKEELPSMEDEALDNNLLESTTASDNIVFMVVGTDTVHTREYSTSNQNGLKTTSINNGYLSEVPWSEETTSKSNDIISTKPKGKAKFIGTSKEEREMALAFMDRIKKKGNPTGSNLECRICKPPRTFTAPTTLVSHYRSHAGIKPYECRICSAVFTRRHSLKYHMLIHQNQTRFTCADCGKKFRHPSHFREHRRRHTGEAPFGCDDCGQRFKTRNTYKRHLKTRHGKVLTTTGELLHLTEEDFEKVKASRKKKGDANKEHAISEGINTSQTVMDFDSNMDQQSTVTSTNEEYSVNANYTIETESTINTMKPEFQTYEICIESQSDKTETLDTDMHVDKMMLNANDNNTEQGYLVKIEDSLHAIGNTCTEDSLEIVHVEESEIIPQEVIEEQPTLIFEMVDENTPFVQYNTDISNTEINSINSLIQCESDPSVREIEHHIEMTDCDKEDYTMTVKTEENAEIQYIEDVPVSQEESVIMISKTGQDNGNDKEITLRKNLNHREMNTFVDGIDSNLLLGKHDTAFMNITGITEPVDMFSMINKTITNAQFHMTDTLHKENDSGISKTRGKKDIYSTSELEQNCLFDKEHNSVQVIHTKAKQIPSRQLLMEPINIKNIKKIRKQSAILLLSNDILKSNAVNIGKNVTAVSTRKKVARD